jgi:hypothetical protein
MKVRRTLLFVALLTGMTVTAAAQEETRALPGITVIGDKELPKVLYIVPWKEAADPGAMTPPLLAPGEAVPAPVNREEFLRMLRYQKFVTRP